MASARWIKGYMQTFWSTLATLHMLRTIGLTGFLGFVFFIGGTVRPASSIRSSCCIGVAPDDQRLDDPLFRKSSCSSVVQSACRQWRLHLSEQVAPSAADGSVSFRAASLHRLLGADLSRLSCAVSSSVPLGRAQHGLSGAGAALTVPPTAR
jgi:hypothetical protein